MATEGDQAPVAVIPEPFNDPVASDRDDQCTREFTRTAATASPRPLTSRTGLSKAAPPSAMQPSELATSPAGLGVPAGSTL